MEKPGKLDYILAMTPIPILSEKKTQKIFDYSNSIDNIETDEQLMHLVYGITRYVIGPLTLGLIAYDIYEKFG